MNPDIGEFEAFPLRGLAFHVNVVNYMQVPGSLGIDLLDEDYSTGEFLLDVTLTHPFPNSDLRGFDVRGIVFGNGPTMLESKADPDLMWLGPDGFRLLNPDGWTRWWNPSEFTTPGLFGYSEGAFGTKDIDFLATLNPYKYFANVLGATDPVVPLVNISNRGTFATDEGPATRQYELIFPKLPSTGKAEFQYAIDASWAPPTGGGSVPGIDDFPISANCPEAFYVSVNTLDSTAYFVDDTNNGGDLVLEIEIFDWSAAYSPSGISDEIQAVRVESPVLFEQVEDVSLDWMPGSCDLSGKLFLAIPDVHPTGLQNQEVLISVLSSGSNSYQPPMSGPDYPLGAELGAYAIISIPISEYEYDPKYVGGFDTTGTPSDIETVGNLCYVLDDVDGLTIVNVSDPEAPLLLNTIALPATPIALDVENAYAYVIDDSSNMQVIDVVPIDTAGIVHSLSLPGSLTSIDIDGSYAYVGGSANSLFIVDINPPETASLFNTVPISTIGPITDIREKDGYAYVAAGDLEIFDVDPPGTASSLKVVPVSSTAKQVDISATGYAFIGDSADQLVVVDVEPVASAAIVDTLSLTGEVSDVACKEDFTCVTVIDEGLRVIGFNEGTGTAYVTGEIDIPTGSDALSIEGNFAYIDGEVTIVELLEEEEPTGWARTWGGIYMDNGNSVAVDSFGGVYVTGHFYDTVDFDPFFPVDNHTSNGAADVFLSKFDLSGNFEWARTWGGTGWDEAECIAVDLFGSVYVFYNGASLRKLDSSGNFEWACTWGGTSGYSVAVDSSGGVYVTGYFWGTVDFDPGPGVYSRTSNGMVDAFLSKFDSSGNFEWAHIWSGPGSYAYGYSVAVDSSDNVYVSGLFMGTVDFDPTIGTDYHISNNGSVDVFLSKFDSSGNYQSARTWGGTSYDTGSSVAVDSSGSVYVTGHFESTVDFDPGSGVDNHTSNGLNDAFLSKLDSSGNFEWARTWGGTSADNGKLLAVDSSGSVYVIGSFESTADFDPGSGVDNHTSNGNKDIFLSRFDSSGNFEWARTWGATDTDVGHSVAVDSYGSAYITGYFHDMVDFYPGAETEYRLSNGMDDIYLSKINPDGYW